jgi:hypothetical protein
MPLWPNPKLALILSVGVVAAGAGSYALVRWRRQPKDKELARRLLVNRHGRLGDATITDLQGDTLYYSYSVGGVSYTASQDVTALREHLPSEPERLIGRAASLKYSPQNPANSILICEEWSGLRTSRLDR